MENIKDHLGEDYESFEEFAENYAKNEQIERERELEKNIEEETEKDNKDVVFSVRIKRELYNQIIEMSNEYELTRSGVVRIALKQLFYNNKKRIEL